MKKYSSYARNMFLAQAAKQGIIYGSRTGMNFMRDRYNRAIAPTPYRGYVKSGRDMGGYYPKPFPVKPLVKVPAKRKAPLAKRVRKLEKIARDEDSVLINKVSAKDTLRVTVNQAFYGYASCVSIAGIEAAAALCRFFDPAAPATLVTASLVTGTYLSKFRVGITCMITFKNNYQVPCYLSVGMVVPRSATSISPQTARTNGFVDQGNPNESSPMLTFKDSKQFGETYRFKRALKRILLKPGQQITRTHTEKSFLYDPAYFDTNTSTFQPKAHSTIWVYRVQGVVGHDTVVVAEEGIMPAGIDLYATDTYTIHYNSGGAPVNTIVLTEGASTSFTTGGVVSQPVVDNQAYSIV